MKKLIFVAMTLFSLSAAFAQDAPDLTVVLRDNADNSVDFNVFTALTDIDGNYLFDLVSVDIDFGDGSLGSFGADVDESVAVTHVYLPGAVYSASLVAVFTDTTITRTFPVEIGMCASGNLPITFGLYESQYIGTGSIDVFYPRMDNTTWSFSLDNSNPLTTMHSFCLAQNGCGSVYMEGALGGYANVYCAGAEEFPLSPDPMFPYVQLCPEILCLFDISEISSGIGYVELNVNQTNCPSVNWNVNGEMQTGHGYTETLYFPTDGIYSILVADSCGQCNQAVSTMYQVEGGNVFLVFSGMEDQDSDTALNLYPNPVIDNLTIQSESPVASLEVMDQAGRLVFRETNIYNSLHSIDFTGFESGIYLLRITEGDGRTTIRQVVK